MNTEQPTLLRGLLSIALLLLVSGCSSFHQEWREAAKQPDPAHEITGRWEGTWQNSGNRHHGRLRAVITRSGEHLYRAHFHAHYAGIFRFAYAVMLTAEQQAPDVAFHGEANLGKLAGGVYRYEGRANPTNFFSRYESKPDTGTFTLHRPQR